MLSNFKNRIRDLPDAPYARNNATTQTQTPETNVPCTLYRSQSDAALPSSRSIIQVLYPPSYLDVPIPFPEPPPYPAQENREFYPLLSTGGTLRSHPDPLTEDPSLTGVPSQGTSRRSLMIEPSPPITGYRYDSEEDEALPTYSRFDQRRPRFPAASDVLGPYPPLSLINQSTH